MTINFRATIEQVPFVSDVSLFPTLQEICRASDYKLVW